MLILNVPEEDIVLHDDENIVSIIFEVAKDENFEDIYVTTDVIPFVSFTHIFNKAVTVGETYYGRAAIITDKRGLFTYTNTSIDTVIDDNNYEPFDEPPALRQPPKIFFDFPNEEIPNTCFKIGIENVGESELIGLVATTWMIRSLIEDKVYFLSKEDTDNLYEIFIDVFLPQNETFIVSAMFHFANDDNTLFSSEIIYVPKSHSTFFVPKETDSDGNKTGTWNDDDEVHVVITIPDNATSGRIEIFKDGEIVYGVDDTEYHDTEATYDSNGMIQVRVKSNLSTDEWTYRTFIQYGKYDATRSEAQSFAYTLPASLG